MKFDHGFTQSQEGLISDHYTMNKEKLGEGSYGQVTIGKHKSTGQERAIKAINVDRISNKNRFNEEIRIQQALDHPNIVKLYEVFKDAKRIYLVMELCTGGELFDKIVEEAEVSAKEGHAFEEKIAAVYMRQIMRAIYYLHSQEYVHRDIKPENFLLQHKGKDAEIKVIDFGLAKKYKPGMDKEDKDYYMQTKAGTPYYVAPQVLAGKYNEKCDIWSCGVILYILLCGYPPFFGERDADILANVKRGKFEFPSPDWDDASKDAKDLIKLMLKMNPDERPNATEVLSHKWFNCMELPSTAASATIKSSLVSKLQTFQSIGRLKRVALTLIAKQMGWKEIEELKAQFEAMDENNDGTLQVAELIDGLSKFKVSMPDDLAETLEKLDTDGSGSIDYTEFIAATMTKHQYGTQERLWEAFRVFDKDGNGMITWDELEAVLNSANVNRETAKKMIAEVDLDGDGCLSFEEFCDMMHKEGGASPPVAPG